MSNKLKPTIHNVFSIVVATIQFQQYTIRIYALISKEMLTIMLNVFMRVI